ncbi:cytochrome c biogenesis protein CcsA [candidate division KSB1 bacterium]|nr:cytochrome c biogenesis protein CcsA [candidate division KSB1 bacterium]
MKRVEILKKIQWISGALILVGMVISLYNVFLFVPTEKEMGVVQRIFYFHVPSAMMSFLAFFTVAVYSFLFLWKRTAWYDRIAVVCAEIGILFTTIALITGSIWARPIWNTWWSWDARLTTFLILWFIYIAYLMLRDYVGDDERGARFASVFAIIGTLDIPIVYFSIRWWRTLHPKPVIAGGEGSGLHPDMAFALYFSMAVFFLLFLFLVATKLRVENAKMELTELKRELALSA